MSRFNENDEYEPMKFVQTPVGFALVKDTIPHRRDVMWKKGNLIFSFDGDEWIQVYPPKSLPLPPGDLKHG